MYRGVDEKLASIFNKEFYDCWISRYTGPNDFESKGIELIKASVR